MKPPNSLSSQSPIITESNPSHTIPQTPIPTPGNPFDTMTSTTKPWEAIIDDRVKLAHECAKSDCAETLEKLLVSPTYDTIAQQQQQKNGGSPDDDDDMGGGDSDDSRAELRALHKATVHAGRTAYDVFHAVIEKLKEDTPKDWEDKIAAAGVMAKSAMINLLDKFAGDAKDVIGAQADGEQQQQQQDEEEQQQQCRVEAAEYFCYCANGYVLFVRKAHEALGLVYEARKGGLKRVCTVQDTAGRVVHEAEVAALKWAGGQNAFAVPAGVSFQA